MANGTRATIESYLDRAIAADPNFAEAYARKAYLSVDRLWGDARQDGERAARIEALRQKTSAKPETS